MIRCYALLICFLVAPLPATAAITRSGSCSAAATSCTLSAVQTGDLKICFAFTSGSNTSPSVPAGWTSFRSAGTTNGGTTAAKIVGCVKASSTSDTGSGTWTGASNVSCVAYAGTAVNTTADCNTSGIGSDNSTYAKASTSILVQSVPTDASSWGVEHTGDSAAVPGTPTGMTSVASSGAAPGARIADSNGAINSNFWGGQSVAVASSTWISDTMEIKALVVAAPILSPSSSVHYASSQNITMSTTTAGATICYRTDGVVPTATTPGTCDAGSTTYTGAIATNQTRTFMAIGTSSGYFNSTVTSTTYYFGVTWSFQYNGSGTAISTTTTMNATGATLIVVQCGATSGLSGVSVSDSSNNTWAGGSLFTSSTVQVQGFYSLNPTTSTSQTFTCTSAGAATSSKIQAIAFLSPYYGTFAFDKSCGHSSASSTGVTTFTGCSSSVTPAAANDLIVAFNGNFGTPTMDSGFINMNLTALNTAWLLDTSSAAINPSWTFASEGEYDFASTMLLFKTTGSSSSTVRKRVRVVQ